MDYQEDLLLDDLRGFNDQLLEYLQRYNGERPHYGLNYLTPCQSIATLLPDLSRSWWHHTSPILVEWFNRKMKPLFLQVA